MDLHRHSFVIHTENLDRDETSHTRDTMSRVNNLGNEPKMSDIVQHSFLTLERENPAVTPGISKDFWSSSKGIKNLFINKNVNSYKHNQKPITLLSQTRKYDSYCSLYTARLKMPGIPKIDKPEESNWFSSLFLRRNQINRRLIA